MSPELIGLLTFIAAAGGHPVHQPYTAPSYLSQQTEMLEDSSRARNAAIRADNEQRDTEQRLNARLINLETQQTRMHNEFLNRR